MNGFNCEAIFGEHGKVESGLNAHVMKRIGFTLG